MNDRVKRRSGVAVSDKIPIDLQRSAGIVMPALRHHKTLKGQCSSGKQ
jgi:hypothetical protein